MKNFIENKYPYALVSIVFVILFFALILENTSHIQDNELSRNEISELYVINGNLKQLIFEQNQKIEELSQLIDSLHVFKKMGKK